VEATQTTIDVLNGKGPSEGIVKLPAHRAGLPAKVISFYIVPLDPAYKAGLAGH
jgi:hypothetical protein